MADEARPKPQKFGVGWQSIGLTALWMLGMFFIMGSIYGHRSSCFPATPYLQCEYGLDVAAFLFAGVFWAAFQLINALVWRNEIVLAPDSLTKRTWGWALLRNNPIELWSDPADRRLRRSLHGKWTTGRPTETITLYAPENRRFVTACRAMGIPVRDQRRRWMAAHARLRRIQLFLFAASLAAFVAAFLLMFRTAIADPYPQGFDFVIPLLASFVGWVASETLIELSARYDRWRATPAAVAEPDR